MPTDVKGFNLLLKLIICLSVKLCKPQFVELCKMTVTYNDVSKSKEEFRKFYKSSTGI